MLEHQEQHENFKGTVEIYQIDNNDETAKDSTRISRRWTRYTSFATAEGSD
jgi:hypothetical protein